MANTFFGTVFQTALKEAVAYRWSMMISIVTGPVFIGIQYLIWSAVFGMQENVVGYTLATMMLYLALNYLTLYVTYDEAQHEFNDSIRTGSFIAYMTRPIPVFWYMFYKKVGDRSLALVVEAIPVGIVLWFVGVNLLSGNIGWYLVSLVIAFFITFCIRFLLGMGAFWLTRTHGLHMISMSLQLLFTGSLFPLELLPLGLQKVFFFLPFQWGLFVPVRAFLGSYELAGYTFTMPQLMIAQFIYAVILGMVCHLVYNKAIKRFSGVGV